MIIAAPLFFLNMAAQEGQIQHTATNHSKSFNYLPTTTTTNLLLLAFLIM